MIITGGENVSPVEIESCLSLHPAVSEVAVVGLPDERWGKVITAFVKRRAASTAEELDAFCRASGLAGFKRPRRYVFVAEIPNRRSANSCAANSLPAITRPNRPTLLTSHRQGTERDRNGDLTDKTRMSACRRFPILATLDGFRVEIDAARSAPTSCSTGRRSTSSTMAERDQLRLFSRRSTRMRACA